MSQLNYNALLSDQTGKFLGPDTRGRKHMVVEQMNDPNTGTTTLYTVVVGSVNE
jgi:hypothetical protein